MMEIIVWPFPASIVHRGVAISLRRIKKAPGFFGPRAFDSELESEKKSPLLFCRSCGSRLVRILLLEPFHTTRRIDQLLLAGEEWMAVRANFHAYHGAFNRRARVKRVAAGAVHLHGVIIGMNSFFHGTLLFAGRSAQPSNNETHGCVAWSAGNLNYIASVPDCNDGLDAELAGAVAAESHETRLGTHCSGNKGTSGAHAPAIEALSVSLTQDDPDGRQDRDVKDCAELLR